MRVRVRGNRGGIVVVMVVWVGRQGSHVVVMRVMTITDVPVKMVWVRVVGCPTRYFLQDVIL